MFTVKYYSRKRGIAMSVCSYNHISYINPPQLRICIKENYILIPTASNTDTFYKYFIESGTFSPPLSEAEIADVHMSQEEFSQGHCTTFENVGDFLESLHRLRERQQREHAG